MDPDGLLFHLGRRDFQVKVRGFRVEIEGVEATLVRAPGITQSAVVVRRNSQGEPMLVAYAAGDRRLIDAERLRAFAVSHLPEGSVPSRFVVLDALPLTASGKVDRRAINALEDATPASRVAGLVVQPLGRRAGDRRHLAGAARSRSLRR